MNRALIIVDVQNDFCEGGSLAVTGGATVARRITGYLNSAHYGTVVATRDYHIDPGGHFSEHPDYVNTWPPHCRAGTSGADFHPALNTEQIQEIFSKGQYCAAYSGFEGTTEDGTSLADWLRERAIDALDIVGIATDHCVRATALDARIEGFDTRVLLDFTAGVAPDTTTAALDRMRAAGVDIEGSVVRQLY